MDSFSQELARCVQEKLIRGDQPLVVYSEDMASSFSSIDPSCRKWKVGDKYFKAMEGMAGNEVFLFPIFVSEQP